LYSLQDDFETHFIRALDQSTIEHITSATMEIKDEIFFGSDATLSYMDNGESKTITLTRLAELMSIIEAQEAGD